MTNVADRLISRQPIDQNILIIRDQRVMLAVDLAVIYGVSTKRLHEQVRRNLSRFPEDFMFQLTTAETAEVAAICGQFKNLKHSSVLPYAFTEYGAIMLANILRSQTAIDASIQVVRAFVRVRMMAMKHHDLLRQINAMEKKYDAQFKAVFEAIRELMSPKLSKNKRIGF